MCDSKQGTTPAVAGNEDSLPPEKTLRAELRVPVVHTKQGVDVEPAAFGGKDGDRHPHQSRVIMGSEDWTGDGAPTLPPADERARSLNLGVDRCGEFLSHPDGRGRVTFPPFSPGPHRPLIHLQIMCELPIRHAAHLPHGVQ